MTPSCSIIVIGSGGLGCTGYQFGVDIESAADHVVPFITTVSGQYQIGISLLSPGGGSITYSNSSYQLSPPSILVGQNNDFDISNYTQPPFPYRRLRWDGVFANVAYFSQGSSAGIPRAIVGVDVIWPGSGCVEGGVIKASSDSGSGFEASFTIYDYLNLSNQVVRGIHRIGILNQGSGYQERPALYISEGGTGCQDFKLVPVLSTEHIEDVSFQLETAG
eukprot:767378-Hanusia_phi.AAC.3